MLDVRAGARGSDAAPDVFERIVFPAQFGAGITAAMDDKDPYRHSQGRDGLALELMQYGLEGDFTVESEDDRRADCTLRLWLYPLPPPEPGTLSIVSPSFGPGLRRSLLEPPRQLRPRTTSPAQAGEQPGTAATVA